MTATVAGIHLGIDTHANRPAGNAVPDGSLYSCSDHSLIYRSNFAGNSWATWATLGSASGIPATLFDAQGDIIVASAADTAARLALGASATYPRSNGTTLAYAFPPGHEFDYAEITSPASPNATSEATATTIITGASVTYDGSTVVLVEFSAPYITPPSGALHNLVIVLYDGSSSIGQLGIVTANPTNASRFPVRMARRMTPSGAAHTYSIRAYVDSGTGTIHAGAGGAAAYFPAFMRITKAT